MRSRFNFETIILTVVTVLLFGLFAYGLGNWALTSYDEAWYGEITRNLVASKNPLKLTFNGAVFTDHPLLGYLLMAIPTLIFGSNEFSVRLVSVILGVGTVLLMYLTGKKLGGKALGISAGAILSSCMWFMVRVRSGNLDIPFLFFEVLTVYLLLSKNKLAIYFAALSFGALILTKTLAGIGLLPVILFILWWRRKEFKYKNHLQALGLFSVIVLPWYVFSQLSDTNFLRHHFFEIGMRSGKNNYGWEFLKPNLEYLAIGVGKWYKPFLVSIGLGGVSFVWQRKLRFNLLVLLLWFLGFATFLFSSETEIWHLIPLYPVIALLVPLAVFSFIEKLGKVESLVKIGILAGFISLSVYQFRQFANLIYFNEPVYSAEREIALKAGKYKRIYLMDTFYPAAVYYSQKNVNALHWHPEAYAEMVRLLKVGAPGVFIINPEFKNRLEEDQINFKVVGRNGSYYLVTE